MVLQILTDNSTLSAADLNRPRRDKNLDLNLLRKKWESEMTERRTDLAVEARESFPRDHVEVKGVVLEKKRCLGGRAVVTNVCIKDEAGSRAMKKPMGTYITVESKLLIREDIDREPLLLCVCEQLEKILNGVRRNSVLIVGLGNREVTSDSLGPRMTDSLFITRHLEKELGNHFMKENKYGCVSAIAPGVMAQTGMETGEILEGIIRQTKPDVVIAVDALAARSVERLCTTVQITDTGIVPGAGVGNRRRELTKKTLGIPVIAIGIPTVVDAETIISDHLESVLKKQGYSEREVDSFLREVLEKKTENFMVTPKNIDESISLLGRDLANILNHCFQKEG